MPLNGGCLVQKQNAKEVWREYWGGLGRCIECSRTQSRTGPQGQIEEAPVLEDLGIFQMSVEVESHQEAGRPIHGPT